MQEINLLQNKLKDTTVVWETRNKLFINVLMLVVILEVAAIFAFIFLGKKAEGQYSALRTENAAVQNELNQKQPPLTGAKAFQAQLKNIRFVLDSHVYWSVLFDELGKKTFNKAQYVSISSDVNGKIHLEGLVGSYTDLGKLILGLSQWDQASDVKLLSSNPSSGEFAGYVFSLEFKVNPEIFIKK